MSVGSGEWIQYKIRKEPMNMDLSYWNWYGFKVLMGWQNRTVQTLVCNDNGKCLVEDTYTKRKFMMDEQNHLVQYFPEMDYKYFALKKLAN